MRKLKLMSIIGAAALALVMVVSATGCGDDASSVNRKSNSSSSKSDSKDKNKDSSSKSKDDSKKQDDGDDDNDDGSSAESKSDNGSSGESKSDNGGSAESKSDNGGSDESKSDSGNDSDSEEDQDSGYIDEQQAGQIALESIEADYGEGDWRILRTEQTRYDGQPCWAIRMTDYSKSQSPDYVYFVGEDFCYSGGEQ